MCSGALATGRTVTHTYAATRKYFVYHGAMGIFVFEWPSGARMIEMP